MDFKKNQIAFLLLFIISCLYAYFNRFIQDDAFISFRYAENFIKGHGLVFNHHEYVEGYTNFLWVFIVSIPMYFDFDVYQITYGFAFFILLVCLIYFKKSCDNIFNDHSTSLIASIAVFLNYSFSSYLSGGLETGLQTTLFIISFYLVLKSSNSRNSTLLYILLSVVFGLLLLNRLDAGLYIVIVYFYIIWDFWKIGKFNFKSLLKLSLTLIVPACLIVLSWLIWKQQYYGDILPNTYHLKIGAKPSMYKTLFWGVSYVAFFVLVYFAIPVLPSLIGLNKHLKYIQQNCHQILYLIITVLVSYNIYFILVGGDFMEFRFQMPLLPFYFIIICSFLSSSLARITFVMISLVCSIVYSNSFKGAVSGFESIPFLSNHIVGEDNDWRGIGIKLNQLFPNAEVKIAISPAGAIPYYSKLYCVDMLGLNDAWIAKNGIKYKNTPGHYKIAPIEYLDQQGVNIIIGHPYMIKSNEIDQSIKELKVDIFSYLVPKLDMTQLSDDKRNLLIIPINESHSLLCWYSIPNDAIESLIAKKTIRSFKI